MKKDIFLPEGWILTMKKKDTFLPEGWIIEVMKIEGWEAILF